ncbi:alpha/beta fold hydrolase [Streptomyces galilaeus]
MKSHHVQVNGARLHVVEAGSGPLVVLLHGFPECWYSWRHQLTALAEAGFRAVAPDMRGYGTSDAPEEVESYTLLHLVGDVVGLIDALGESRAVVAGHDWGAPVAWHTALMRPDLVRGVAGLSVPPPVPAPEPPLKAMRALHQGRFYTNYFEQAGRAEREFGADVRGSLLRILYGASGDNPTSPLAWIVPDGGGFLDIFPNPDRLPSWLAEEDLEVYVEAFTASGFTGSLNWYRNMDRNWELTAPWKGARIDVPALYIAGDKDLAVHMPGRSRTIGNLPQLLPGLTRQEMLAGCGHWTQQERPAEVNALLLEFLYSLD